MATTLVERAKQVIAAEQDDYFKADTVLFYLNRSQRQFVSTAIQREIHGHPIHDQEGRVVNRVASRSLRVLDLLRSHEDIDLGSLTFEDAGHYFTGAVTLPGSLNQFLYLRYGLRTPLRELTSDKLVQLDWGRLKPTINESYYYLTSKDNNIVFELYLPEEPSNQTNLRVFYVGYPTDIDINSVEFDEIPSQAESAVIYGAALTMSLQESIQSPQSNIEALNQVYQQKLNEAIY